MTIAPAMSPISTPKVAEQVKTQPVVTPRAESEKLFRIDPLQDPRWNDFIERHPHGSVFHSAAWLGALRSCYGYKPVAVTTSSPADQLHDGLPFCEIRSLLTGNRLVAVPFSDHCEPLVDDRQTFDRLVECVRQDIGGRSWKYLEIRPLTYLPRPEAGFVKSDSYFFHRIDLRVPEQVLFKRFHRDSVQRKIRRAEREGLRYEEGRSDKLLNCFYKLLILTRRRHGLPPQPLAWFRSLIAAFGENVQIRAAFKNDLPLASILTITHKKTMVYKYGGSDLRYSNLGGNSLVFWRAMQGAKTHGLEEFDMGRSDLENKGLALFKERWGAQRSVVDYWRYPAEKGGPGIERHIRHLSGLLSVAPDSSLTALSRLFYRHIG